MHAMLIQIIRKTSNRESDYHFLLQSYNKLKHFVKREIRNDIN